MKPCEKCGLVIEAKKHGQFESLGLRMLWEQMIEPQSMQRSGSVTTQKIGLVQQPPFAWLKILSSPKDQEVFLTRKMASELGLSLGILAKD